MKFRWLSCPFVVHMFFILLIDSWYWIPHVCKLNFDEITNGKQNSMGIGGIIRDRSSSSMISYFFLQPSWSLFSSRNKKGKPWSLIESLGCFNGLCWAPSYKGGHNGGSDWFRQWVGSVILSYEKKCKVGGQSFGCFPSNYDDQSNKLTILLLYRICFLVSCFVVCWKLFN